MTDPVDALRRMVTDKIASHGWEVIAVFPVEGQQDGPMVDFAYTAGLTAKGQPELLVVGLPPDAASAVLNDVAQIVVAHGCADGDRVAGVTAGDYELCLRRPVDDRDAGVPCSAARVVYGEEVEVAQVVWPDVEHRFPWDDGFAVATPLLSLAHAAPPTDARRLVPTERTDG